MLKAGLPKAERKRCAGSLNGIVTQATQEDAAKLMSEEDRRDGGNSHGAKQKAGERHEGYFTRGNADT